MVNGQYDLITMFIGPVWIPQLWLPSVEIRILSNKAHLNFVKILYAVLLVHLFSKETNHIWFFPSSGKFLWYLIWGSLRTPSLHHQIELMLEISHQRGNRGHDAICVLNSYQQLVIRNPYLESNYFVKFAVYFIILWHSLYLVYHFLSLPDWKFDTFCTFWVFLFDSMIVLLFAVQILIIWGFSKITRNYAETIPFHKISTLWN